MPEESYSASLYALLSDKIRERNAAITTLRSIFPLEVKNPEFTSESGQNFLKSFLNWLQAEIRIARKPSNSNVNILALSSALKELKWVIGLLDENFPRIDLSGIILELIDRLTDVLCCERGGFTEVLFILNQKILCKAPYLNMLKDSKLAARSSRLITILYEQLQSTDLPEAFIKTLSFLAISLPESLKFEALSYEMLHESFIWYLSESSNGKIENSSLLSVINSLLLDYFEHSRKFGLRYFGFVLPLLKSKNNLVLFSKALEYFTLLRNDLTDEHVQQLLPLLEKELEESQNCQFHSVDPSVFCKQILSKDGQCATLAETCRLALLKLCVEFNSQISSSVHLIFYKLLKTTQRINVSTVIVDKRVRNHHEWTALLQFHSQDCSYKASTNNLNWYKLWFICENPDKFQNSLIIEDLDAFVERSLLNEIGLDSLAFEALSSYYKFRFKNLWWNASAESSFQTFLNSSLNSFIEAQRIDFSLEFLKCLFAPFQLQWKTFDCDRFDDVKAFDCHLFYERLKYLENRSRELSSEHENTNAKVPDNEVTSNVPPSKFYIDSLKSFIVKIQEILEEESSSFACSETSQSSNGSNKKTSQDQILSFKFVKFLVELYGNSQEVDFDLSWITEIPHKTKTKSSKFINVLWTFSSKITSLIELDKLLSILIPKYNEIIQETSSSSIVFDEFRTKNSQFEVNLMTSEVFKQQQVHHQKPEEDLLLVDISRILYSAYSLKDDGNRLTLNDWNVYTVEVLGISLEFQGKQEISLNLTTQLIADNLRNYKAFFDFPFNLNSITQFDPFVVLPPLSGVYKKLTTPEQWIPFIFLLLKSSKSSISLSTEWLTSCLLNCKLETESQLYKLIKGNVSSALAYSLLLNWISDPSRFLSTFPFKLFTSEDSCDFVMKSPHFLLILSKVPSIDTIVKMFHGSDENSNVLLRNSNYLVASGILEESSAKLSNRKPVDLSFLKTPAINSSIKFIPLVTALLSHGQWHPWSVVVNSLQSLAKIFKLSAAPDFSDIFSPVHSVLIIRSLVPIIYNVDLLINLFANVPILTHHPQLLKLTVKILQEHKGNEDNLVKSFKSKFKVHEEIGESIESFSFSLDDSHDSDLITFILSTGHSTIFSKNFSIGLFELTFRILNLSNVNGNRQFSLDSLKGLSQNIRDDLKMLVLPLGSRIVCFDSKRADVKCNSSVPDWTALNYQSTSAAFLKDLCKFLLHLNDTKDSVMILLLDVLESDETFNENFLKFILKKLFEPLAAKPSSFTGLIKKITEKLELSDEMDSLLIEILHLIIEITPIGPNLVDNLLRRFNFNVKIFKRLQNSNPKAAFYYFSLLRESPKLSNQELDLQEFVSTIETSETGEEYISIARKRLSKFEQFETEWPKEQVNNFKQSNELHWLNKKWFDQNDFDPKRLNLKEFQEQAKKLNYLYNLLRGKEQISFEDDSLKIIESCIKNKKSTINFKEILNLSNDHLSPKSFQIISLLSLCSPKLEMVSRHLLADMKSKIHWQRGEFEEAIEAAQGALNLIPSFLPDELRALLLSRLGEWTAASKSQRPSHILSQYLEKAMTLCENTSNFSPASLAQIHIKVARFVDDQYQQIKESEDFKLREKLLEESRNALNAARSSSTSISASQDRRQIEIGISTLRSQYELDMQEYSERLRSLKSFLLKSVQNYISALSFGVSSPNDQMAAISRLCALWFSNPDFNDINELINNSISSNSSSSASNTFSKRFLPLQLFLPLIYQLAARASYDKTAKVLSPFQRTLVRLLVQLTINFPFDCIYQLLALKAGNTDDDSSTRKRKLFEPEGGASEADLRAAAASLIIDQTRKVSGNLLGCIGAIERLVDAYIELANLTPATQALKSSTRTEFGQKLKISQFLYLLPSESPLRMIPIPTGPVDGELFAGFIDGYKLLGGINLPKQIEAVSSNGTRHAQLVKGRDDVRQDAVMEQVFLRVNRLLAADEVTRRRGLTIRTYRVIPLRPLVGLLEWVSDSVPLATYLTEAHERLRPGDLHPSKCRDLLKAEAERPGSTVQSKLNVLMKDIGQRFRPVMRYFFFEHFNVKDWWTAKQAYTTSMATASIVGWIVGLGDRHGMNILLDKKTGEVVHIDLNMIFEAGRTLRVPERVPFRLTPDCVDGLGPEGIGLEGPFKNHAVAALKVLRREKSLLMMIMDVFKYDPLQKWAGIAKAIEQNNTNKTTNNNNTLNNTSASSDLITKEADRALMRIKEKLEGREEGVVLSESGHVAFLIQTATDPELLCQMYFGWQPYF